MDRNNLIALSLKYNGEYDKIIQAVKNGENDKLNENVDCITIFDKEYPKKLFDLRCPPLVLYYKGNIKLLNENFEAITGSRSPGDYSSKITKEYSKGKDVICGLANGINRIACENANRFIGVLGCGIDYIYPTSNYDLFKKAALLISEYPGMVKPLAYHLPFRNRIIVALCSKVSIMECKEKSGTSVLINYAMELGKDISVLPFAIDHKEGRYNNQLISEGANIVLDY